MILQTLACGATQEAAALKAGVNRRTVIRRLKDPEFRRRLTELKADMANRTSAMLTASGGEFAKTLLALVKENVRDTVRLGAARAGLELGMKSREKVELEARIAALE